jgi:ABC-type sugar transport system ATPase subunit
MNAFAQLSTTQPAIQPSGLNAAVPTEHVINISKLQYAWRNSAALVLDIDKLQVERGERVFIAGPSGSGKSTLLSLLAGVVIPHKGTVMVLDRRMEILSGAQRDRFRADHIGFIFQMFNLIPYLSVVENVTLSCRPAHAPGYGRPGFAQTAGHRSQRRPTAAGGRCPGSDRRSGIDHRR